MTDYYDTSYPPSLWDGSNPPDTPVPTLASVTPNSIVTGAPAVLTLTGTGFVNGAQALFDATPYPAVWVSATELTVNIAAAPAARAYSVAVRNPDGDVSNVRAVTVTAVTPEEPEGA